LVLLTTTEACKFTTGFTILIFRDDACIARACIIKVFPNSVGARIIFSHTSVGVGDDAWMESTQYK